MPTARLYGTPALLGPMVEVTIEGETGFHSAFARTARRWDVQQVEGNRSPGETRVLLRRGIISNLSWGLPAGGGQARSPGPLPETRWGNQVCSLVIQGP